MKPFSMIRFLFTGPVHPIIRIFPILFYVAIILVSYPVYSQDGDDLYGKANSIVVENNYGFELFVKRQSYTFSSFEYESSTRNPYQDSLIQNDGLKQNSKILVPMMLRYEDSQRNFWIETSYYEIEIVNSNTVELTTYPDSFSLTRRYFPALIRSEAEINAIKFFEPESGLKLGIGGGGKNINKYIYGKYNLSGAYQEYYLTYGPQLSLRLEWNFLNNLFLTGMVDAFYTQGNRFSDNLLIDTNQLRVEGSIAGKKGLYRGVESDMALYFRFFEKFKIGVGYNRIDSFFSPLNNHSIIYILPDPLNNQNPETIQISQGIQNGAKETLHGLYAVLVFAI